MSLLLSTDALSKSYGARLLFKGISISFDDTERTGLIGPNGAGKSTLLKILAGVEHSDDGTITARRQLRAGYLPQEDLFDDDETVESALLNALDDDHSDMHEQETRAQILLGKVGFTDFQQKAATLSGGWRKRLAIARQLIRKPDLLLLDEPTNHLDVEGILWLESILKSAPFAVLLVSHDRYFLENVCNRIVELNRSYADGYLSVTGNYGDFLEKREGYLAAQASRQQAVASRVRREIEWLHRGAKARTTKAKGRIEQAGEMMSELAELKSRNKATGSVKVDFNATERKTRKLLVAKNVSKSLGDRKLIGDLNLVLGPGSKLGLLGPNGSGKTTLVRIFGGELKPDSGEMIFADGVRIVVFDQKRAQLDKSQTVRRALSPGGDNVVYRGNSMHVSGFAEMFLFDSDQLDLPVSELSGGEQARILIANLMRTPADVLVLDEPTNDLDIPTLEVLEESLEEFPGALVLVTHDRFMLSRISTDILGLDGKGNSRLYADLNQWERAQEAAAEEAAAAKRASNAKPAAAGGSSAPPKKLSYMEQREFEGIEAKIQAAEESLNAAQARMNDPVVLGDRNKLHEVCVAVDQAQKTVHDLYARWETLEKKRA